MTEKIEEAAFLGPKGRLVYDPDNPAYDGIEEWEPLDRRSEWKKYVLDLLDEVKEEAMQDVNHGGYDEHGTTIVSVTFSKLRRRLSEAEE